MFKSRGDSYRFLFRNCVAELAALLLLLYVVAAGAKVALSQTIYDGHESERSDKLTGGRIERAEFEPGEPDIRVTLNVPSFVLTLWQNGKEVKSYFVGVGLKAYPIYIGDREAREIIWNPAWTPPASDWVRARKGVRSGEVILPRNVDWFEATKAQREQFDAVPPMRAATTT